MNANLTATKTTPAGMFDPELTYYADGTAVVVRAQGTERPGVTVGMTTDASPYQFQTIRFADGTTENVAPHVVHPANETETSHKENAMNANLTSSATAPATSDEELTNGKTPCNCSDNCPGLTTRYFSQGHDARLVTRLRNAVTAGQMTTAEAFAEITKRGGTERLQIKLDAAVANARKPKAKGKKIAKRAKVTTFELDGFTLVTPPQSTKPVVAKVGRWEYNGTLRTHRSGETGATKDDTFMVFEFVNKAGELVETTKYKFVADIVPVAEVMDAVAAKMAEEVAEAAREEVAELPFNAPANRVATPAPGFEAPADEDTSDIPF